MIARSLVAALLLATAALAQNKDDNKNNNKDNNNNNNANNNKDGLALLESVVQKGSFQDGTKALGAEDGQAVSQTSQNNFINFCEGKTLTNGLQIVDGSCNGIGKFLQRHFAGV